MPTDDELSRLAEQALLREAQRGAQRAQVSGPSGWLRCKLPSTNKTFLQNTLLGALASNRVKERREKSRIESGRRKRQLEERERSTYKRVYLKASTKPRPNPLPDETNGKGCESHDTKEKKQKQSDQAVIWTETGLELTNNNLRKVSSKTESKSNYRSHKNKTNPSSLLSREIKFTSSSDKERDNSDKT